MDIHFELENNVFNYRVAAIIRNKDKILVSYNKDKNYLSLLGGRCQVGEDSIEAIKREIEEETTYKTNFIKTIGIVENFYVSRYSSKPYHEILIIHEVEFVSKDVYEKEEIVNLEDNGKCIWKSIDELKNSNFKPNILDSLDKPIFHIINKDLSD